MRLIVLLTALTIAVPNGPAPLAAQEARDDSGGSLFTAGDALWASGFVAGTLLLAPLDAEIALAARDSTLQENAWIAGPANGFRLLGFPGSVLITGGMYAVGRLADRPVLAEIGFHGAQAIAIASGVTLVTKTLAGRARPYADPENPLNFEFGRGWSDDAYQSFPSGHSTAAFAAAAAITAEIDHRWPEAELTAGTLLFGTAALVGASRLYHNVHWATDAAAGAAIGTLVGWKVVRYAHNHPDNRLDRWFLGATISPAADGHAIRLWVAPLF